MAGKMKLSANVVAAFIAVAVVAPILWMALDRDPPYINSNGRVVPAKPPKNSNVTIEWDIKAVRSCQPTEYSSVTRTIVDARGVRHVYAPISATYGTIEQFRPDEIKRTFRLPLNVTGEVSYSANVCYACNPIQVLWPVCFTTPTIRFSIVDE